MIRRWPARIAAVVTVTTLGASGCAGLGTTSTGTTRADLAYEPGERLRDLPVFAADTEMEREPRARDDRPRNQKITPALFWTGIIAGSLGTAGTVGFGVAGRAVENDIHDGYDSGFTAADAESLRDKGSLYNSLAITSAVVGVLGWATALIVYGVDYTRCGPLVAKNEKRNCPE